MIFSYLFNGMVLIQGQGDAHIGAFSINAADVQRSAVHGHDVTAHRKADTGAAPLGSAFVKFLFDEGQLVL